MNQALGDIVVNNIYRTCFKELGGRQDKEIGGGDKQAVANCFERIISAFQIVSPTVFKTFDYVPPAADEEGGDEEEEAAEDE